MNLLIILRVALRSLRRTLLRSALTALGIIIGVAAVIAMISIGNGAKSQIQTALSRLDPSQIKLEARPGLTFGPQPRNNGLTLDDYQAIRRQVAGIGAVTPQLQSSSLGREARADGRKLDVQVGGYDTEAFPLFSRQLLEGTVFGDADVSRAASVCVISENVARRLFPRRRPVGQTLYCGTAAFRVIGVMTDLHQENSGFLMVGGEDTGVWIPYTTLLARLDRNAEKGLGIFLKAQHLETIETLQEDLKNLMESRRGRRTAVFMVNNLKAVLGAIDESTRTMRLLLAAIASISLVVGGVGIMNIMLVSVTERTREIGIRLAIGTRGRDVLRQFLIEAVILSLLGGFIGIAAGVAATQLVSKFNHWPTEITSGSILGAFGCAAAIGVFFGWYPARKASQLDPIEALRHE